VARGCCWSCCSILRSGIGCAGGDEVFIVRLVEEDARAVEEEPGNRKAEDCRDVDRLAELGAGALVVNRVEQVNQLVLFEIAVAAGADLDGLR